MENAYLKAMNEAVQNLEAYMLGPGAMFHPIWTPHYLLDLEHQLAQLAVLIPTPLMGLYDVPIREIERLVKALESRIDNFDSRRMF